MLVPGSLLMLSGLVQAVVGFLAGLYLASQLGPEAFGRFAIVFALSGVALSIATLRIDVLIIRAPESEFTRDRQETYFSALAIETMSVGLLAAMAVALTGGSQVWDFLLVISQCALHWIGVNKAFFERGMPYKQLTMIEAGATLLGHLAAVALVAAGVGAAALYLREVLFAVGGLTLVRVRLPAWQQWRQLLRDARAVWLDAALEGSFQRITTLVASGLGTDRQVGHYFMAQSLAMRPNQLLGPATSRLAANWLRHLGHDQAQRSVLNRLLWWVTAPLAATAVVTLLFADPLVGIVLGENWLEATPVLQALLGVILFQTLFEILRTYTLVTRRMHLIMASRLAQYLGFAVTLGGTLLLPLPPMAALGIAASASFFLAFATLWCAIYLYAPAVDRADHGSGAKTGQ
jgi:O-antigen/teichoic acid export membrane protein